MKMIFEWLCATLLGIGIICSIIIGLRDIYKYILKKSKIKSIRKRRVIVVVKDKYFSPGSGYEIPNPGVVIKSASYRVEVIYNERLYVLHNKQIFELVNAGDTLEMNLVEKIDKYENIIDSYLEVLSNKYK